MREATKTGMKFIALCMTAGGLLAGRAAARSGATVLPRARLSLGLLVAVCGALITASVASAGTTTTTTFAATKTLPVPPASNYAGAGGGDGWAVALSNTQVFNIFHHNGVTTLACPTQSDASHSYPQRTITDWR